MRQRRKDVGTQASALLHTQHSQVMGAVAPGSVRKGTAILFGVVFLAVYQGLTECCIFVKLY